MTGTLRFYEINDPATNSGLTSLINVPLGTVFFGVVYDETGSSNVLRVAAALGTSLLTSTRKIQTFDWSAGDFAVPGTLSTLIGCVAGLGICNVGAVEVLL